MDTASKNTFKRIFESIGEGVLVLNDQGQILHSNACLEKMMGYSKQELKGQEIELLVPMVLRQDHVKLREKYMQAPFVREMGDGKHFRARRKDGSEILVRIGLSTYKEEGEHRAIAIISDVSIEHEIQQSLVKAQERAQLYLDIAKVLFVVVDKEGLIKMVNREGLKVLGYLEEELKGQHFSKLLPSEERRYVQNIFDVLMKGDHSRFEFVKTGVLTKEGSVRRVQWHNSLLLNEEGEPEGTLSSGVDITNDEELEQARTEAMITGMEQERKRFAAELHDGLVQTLSAVSLNLKALEEGTLQLSQMEQEAYKSAMELLTLAIKDTRNLSHAMMPAAMNLNGLVRSIEDMAIRATRYTKLKVLVKADPVDNYINDFIRFNLFRIAQELIYNVFKHAEASQVIIRIKKNHHFITFSVEDNGKGFIDDASRINAKGIGFKNINTRLDSLNGQMKVKTIPKKGSIISIIIPIE